MKKIRASFFQNQGHHLVGLHQASYSRSQRVRMHNVDIVSRHYSSFAILKINFCNDVNQCCPDRTAWDSKAARITAAMEIHHFFADTIDQIIAVHL